MRRLLAATLALSFALVFTFAFTHGGRSAARQQEQPRVTNRIKPKYPVMARLARMEKVVHVDVEIDAEGRVASAKTAEEAHPLLRGAAEEAAALWTFERAGAGLRSVRLTFDFRLEVERRDKVEDAETLASPYHVIVRFAKVETVSHVPPDADNMTCEAHGFKLERDKVKIVYGLLVYAPEYEEAERRLFPRATTTWEGGCVVTDESPEFAEVLFCAACRAARKDWLEARGANTGGGD